MKTLTHKEEVEQATSAADLFPPGADADARYRELAKAVHPDAGGSDDLFQKLGRLYSEHTQPPVKPTLTITSRRATYVVGDVIPTLDPLTAVYPVSWKNDDGHQSGLLRLPRSPRDSDLMEREAKALKAFNARAADEDVEDFEREALAAFLPELVDSFRHRTPSGQRRAVVVRRPPAGMTHLAAFDQPLHPRDVAWIFRRILTGLGAAHHAGYVHGALDGNHVLVQAEEHGLMIEGWTAATEPGGTVPYANVKHLAPPEIRKKEPVTPATDIYAAGRLGLDALDPSERRLSAFMRGCMLSKTTRPQDSWKLLAEFDDLLRDMWGKPKFHVMEPPAHPTY